MSFRSRVLASAVLPGAAMLALTLGSAPAVPAGASALATSAHRPVVVIGSGSSNNWSGYDEGIVGTSTPLNAVSGSWVVPTATYHQATGAPSTENSSTWVGVGGGCIESSCTLTDPTSLIQAGTEQDVSSAGTATYYAWWEIVPAPSVIISNFTVRPGDAISVVIAQTLPEVWTITLTDGSQSFTQTIPYSSSMLTAEWIEETPVVVGTGSSGIATLPNLSKVGFDLATVNGHPANLTPDDEMTLQDLNGNTEATPSTPDSDSDGFAVCSWSQSCSPPGIT